MTSLDAIAEKLDTLTENVSELTTNVAAIVQGLDMMLTTLGTHSEMLGNVLEFCSVEEDGAPELHDALVEIANEMARQNDLLTMIGGNLNGLGVTVQTAVIQGFARVLNPAPGSGPAPGQQRADEDGVIIEDDEGDDDDGHHGHTH